MTDSVSMTNFLPTLSVTFQAIQPSLHAAALRMTGEEFKGLANETHQLLSQDRYGELTSLLEGRQIKPTSETLNQLVSARLLFLGELPPDNLGRALQSMPQNFGDEAIDRLLALEEGKEETKFSRQELVNVAGSPYFRGDFSRVLKILGRRFSWLDEVEKQRFGQGDPTEQFFQRAIDLSTDVLSAVSLATYHRYHVHPPLGFYVRKFVQYPDVSIKPLMRNSFFRGFHCDNETVRLAYVTMSPAICSDPKVKEGLKVAIRFGLSRIAITDPSQEIRHAARRSLAEIPEF